MGLFDFLKNNEQQVQQAQSYPEHSPLMQQWAQDDMGGVIGVTLDNDRLLQDLENYLRGIGPVTTYSEKGEPVTKWEQVGKPAMNEMGVQAVMREVRLIVNKNTILTNMPDIEKLNDLMKNFSVSVAILLGAKAKEFNIDESQRHSVYFSVVRTAYLTLLRGLNGNEKKGVYKENKSLYQYHMMNTNGKGARPF